MLYRYCDDNDVPYKKTGKLVVARKHQESYVESLHAKAQNLRLPARLLPTPHTPALPTRLISGDEARDLEPNLSPGITAALLSPETGILDSHSFMKSLEREITESLNGEVMLSTSVVRVDPYSGSTHASGVPDLHAKENGWVVQLVTQQADGPAADEGDSLLARTLINASGLSGTIMLNSLLSPDARISMYYARGSYAAYKGPGVEQVSRLLYPCPETQEDVHAFQSLGTHLTLDISGNIKFGPDIQWISPEHTTKSTASPVPAHDGDTEQYENYSCEESDIDFWKRKLRADDIQIEEMYEAVKRYLPGVELSKFRPDYVGIRPKLVPPWGGFQDFVFRKDHSTNFLRTPTTELGRSGTMVSLLGIESPGLTASFAIAERVISLLDEGQNV